MYKEKKTKKDKQNGTGGFRTPVTGVAARNAADWATQALDKCGLLHVFNPLSHAATISYKQRHVVHIYIVWK